jgi:hypothetical protein
MGALPGNTQLLRDVSDRPPLLEHTLDQQHPSANIQAGISVRQENLLAS